MQLTAGGLHEFRERCGHVHPQRRVKVLRRHLSRAFYALGKVGMDLRLSIQSLRPVCLV